MSESSSIAAVTASLRTIVEQAQPGDRLPSSRDLRSQMGVGPVTVSRALAQLLSEGLVTTRAGVGTFVAPARVRRRPRAQDFSWQTMALGENVIDESGMAFLLQPPTPGGISLANGYPHPSLSPARQLSASLVRAARRPDAWERPELNGLRALRAWFADAVGPSVTVDDVLITSGGQAALSTALRATLAPGSSVLVESPTYLGLLALARAAGLRPVPVPTDEYGIRPDMLAEAFARTRATVMYFQPTFHNPTGALMSRERAREVLAVAAAAGAFVIEDDWGRWLTHDKPPPPTMASMDEDGRVIHVKSLTKATAASLRIGALIARGPVAQRLNALRLVDDFFVNGPLQEAALDFLSSPAWPRHLGAFSLALRQRCDALMDALQRHLPALEAIRPAGGFYVWARLPPGHDDVAVAEAAQRAGIVVGAGRPFFAAEPPGAFLRLSFSGPANVTEIEEGVRRLSAVLR